MKAFWSQPENNNSNSSKSGTEHRVSSVCYVPGTVLSTIRLVFNSLNPVREIILSFPLYT